MKSKYIKPATEKVCVRLHDGVLDDDITVGGQSARTKPSDSLGNENSMFDTEEGEDPQQKQYSLWDWDF